MHFLMLPTDAVRVCPNCKLNRPDCSCAAQDQPHPYKISIANALLSSSPHTLLAALFTLACADVLNASLLHQQHKFLTSAASMAAQQLQGYRGLFGRADTVSARR